MEVDVHDVQFTVADSVSLFDNLRGTSIQLSDPEDVCGK